MKVFSQMGTRGLLNAQLNKNDKNTYSTAFNRWSECDFRTRLL